MRGDNAILQHTPRVCDAALEHARSLAARGLSVIPVPRPDDTHDGKRPVIAWREYQSRLASEDEIRAWFATEQNIGVVTGAVSGIVVVDVDSPGGLEYVRRRLPWTPWQTKTSRGYHLFYRHPGGRVGNAARVRVADDAALDVRGDGGFVIGPGSVHASGARYTYAGDWTRPRACLPFYWPGWVRQSRETSPSRPARPSSGSGAELVARARAYLARIPLPEIGAGSDLATLYAAARLVRGFGLAEQDAIDVLWEWCGHRPHWTREWVARKVRNAARYGTEQVGSLA